jgi:hypothetical protein
MTTAFQTYKVELQNIIPVTTTVKLQLLVSTDNGSTWVATNYRWANNNIDSAATNASSGSTSDSSWQIASAIPNSASGSLSGELILYDMENGTFVPKFSSSTVYGVTPTSGWMSGGVQTSVTAITAIRFQMSSGNISSGTFVLYGVTEP